MPLKVKGKGNGEGKGKVRDKGSGGKGQGKGKECREGKEILREAQAKGEQKERVQSRKAESIFSQGLGFLGTVPAEFIDKPNRVW